MKLRKPQTLAAAICAHLQFRSVLIPARHCGAERAVPKPKTLRARGIICLNTGGSTCPGTRYVTCRTLVLFDMHAIYRTTVNDRLRLHRLAETRTRICWG